MEGESVSEETEGRVSGERAGECEWRGGECKCGERERKRVKGREKECE